MRAVSFKPLAFFLNQRDELRRGDAKPLSQKINGIEGGPKTSLFKLKQINSCNGRHFGKFLLAQASFLTKSDDNIGYGFIQIGIIFHSAKVAIGLTVFMCRYIYVYIST